MQLPRALLQSSRSVLLQHQRRSRISFASIQTRHAQRSVLGASTIGDASPSLSTGCLVPHRRFLSSTSATAVAVAPGVTKLGLGGHKWSQAQASRYYKIVQTALEAGVTTLEAGQEGGDRALAEAYENALSTSPPSSSTRSDPLLLRHQPVTLLSRIGYRTIEPPDVDDVQAETAHAVFLPNDVHVDNITKEADATDVVAKHPAKVQQVVHNIGRAAVAQAVADSPLPGLAAQYEAVSLTLMIHNPEVQAAGSGEYKERQDRIRRSLEESFAALEEQVAAGKITSYGVASNGLALPSHHPLHLAWSTIFEAAEIVESVTGKPLRLAVIQLPVNLLETAGLTVAREIRDHCLTIPSLSAVQVYAMRPLTCYPDQGTGDGFPFVLADYKLPATMEKTLQWTNTMSGPPAAYELALKTAMAHFDAEEILLAKQQGATLTAEQRETLDGCKLMQSLLHDVDTGLDKVRSFAAHEQELYQSIIPLIHDTFEGYDDETAAVLQSFFAAYSLAVKYSIARNTRRLLVEGESTAATSGGRKIPGYPDIPPEQRLQEYALQFLLKEDSINMIISGCSQPDQVLDSVEIVQKPIEKAGDDADTKDE